MKHTRDTTTQMKREWIRAKRTAKANDEEMPLEPNYTDMTQKNQKIEKMVVMFTELVRNVEDAMDLCEEMYSLDMEEIRSLLSSMYGVNIEVSTMLNNDEEE